MISKSYLLKNLDLLESLYNRTSSAKRGLFYSKLAVLELCGWVEESMDDIIRMCAHRRIRDKNIQRYIEEQIQKTYGFEYERHFRTTLSRVIGMIGIKRLEKKVDQAKFAKLVAKLDSLKTYRNIEAHPHIKGVTKRLDAPSLTKANFLVVYEGLKEIEDKLRTLGY